MIDLALGVSRSPVVFNPPEEWPAVYERMLRGKPMPPQGLAETEEVRKDQSARIQAAYGVLNKELKSYKPDTILLIGDDNFEVFSGVAQPSLNIFVGRKSGATNAQIPEVNPRTRRNDSPSAVTQSWRRFFWKDWSRGISISPGTTLSSRSAGPRSASAMPSPAPSSRFLMGSTYR